MGITTVLLDGGGVILDESIQEEILAEIAVEILGGLVPGYSTGAYYSDIEEAVRSFCPNAYQYVFWKHAHGDLPIFEKLYTLYAIECQRRKPALRLNSGLQGEVKAISRDYQLGIAGQYGREILQLLERESILDCFAFHFTQDDFSITKPDPRYYEQIVSACGVEPEQCIMVGDRIDKDVIPAKQIRMKTVLIRVGLHRNQQARIPSELPDMELKGVSGLATAVRQLVEKM